MWVAIPSIVIATVLGLLLAVFSTAQNRLLRIPTVVFVDIFRTIPVICLLFWVHYVLPMLTGWRFSAAESAIISLSLNGAAFTSEAFRGGWDRSRPRSARRPRRSDFPASDHALRHLPGAFFMTLPAVTNVHITIIKTVPIAVVIAVPEVMFRAQELTVQFFRPLELYTGAAALYVGLVILYTMFMRGIERLRKWEPI